MNGIDGLQLIKTNTMAEAIVLSAASRRAWELRVEELDHLAAKIRNEIVEAWNKGNK